MSTTFQLYTDSSRTATRKTHRGQSKLLEGKAGRGASGAEAHQLKGGLQVNAGLRRRSLLNLEIRQKFEI